MSEMIERVARALAASNFESDDPDYTAKHVDAAWPNYVGNARAAIKAMREPPDEICRAGLETGAVDNDDFYVTTRNIETIWQAMIDAALEEK